MMIDLTIPINSPPGAFGLLCDRLRLGGIQSGKDKSRDEFGISSCCKKPFGDK